MSTETLLREHFQAAAQDVQVDAKPLHEMTRRVRKTRVLLGLGAAAVLVAVVGAVGLTTGDSDDLIIPPPVSEGAFDISVLDLLPDGFDPVSAPSLFPGFGDPAAVAQAYLGERVGVETAVLSVEVTAPDQYAVRWGWGQVAGISRTQDDGDLGWVLLRGDADGNLYVIAAVTDGVDVSDVQHLNGRVSIVVESTAASGGIAMDVLDMTGAPVDGAPNPDGVFPGGDVRYGTAGVADSGVPGQITSLAFAAEGIDEPVVLRVHLVGGALLTVSEVVLEPALDEEAPAITTTSMPPSTTVTTTTDDPPEVVDELVAWTAVDAERDVENLLAALAAGAYQQAAWPMENNGGVYDDQGRNESNSEFLARVCAGGACLGPYEVVANGPGLVDPVSSQASSTVTVTHTPTGTTGEMTVGTFEGQRMVMGLPPLVPSNDGPTLVAELFGEDLPSRVVVQRFDAFEIWEDGSGEWVTNWWARDAQQAERGVVLLQSEVVGLTDPSVAYAAECGRLMTRSDEVLLLQSCSSDDWAYTYLLSGDDAGTPIAPISGADGQWSWFTERNGVILTGQGDAEGNLVSLESERGVDLAGDDYIGYLTLSVDGSRVAYVDHRDDSAYSHFWSPIVVVKDVASGAELDRWVLDAPVLCLEFSGDWVVACEGRSDLSDLASGMPEQEALVAINVETGQVNRVETRVRVFLPG